MGSGMGGHENHKHCASNAFPAQCRPCLFSLKPAKHRQHLTWNTRARPPKNQVPRRMTIMTLMALDRVPPRYSQLLRLAIIAAPHHKRSRRFSVLYTSRRGDACVAAS